MNMNEKPVGSIPATNIGFDGLELSQQSQGGSTSPENPPSLCLHDSNE